MNIKAVVTLCKTDYFPGMFIIINQRAFLMKFMKTICK